MNALDIFNLVSKVIFLAFLALDIFSLAVCECFLPLFLPLRDCDNFFRVSSDVTLPLRLEDIFLKLS